MIHCEKVVSVMSCDYSESKDGSHSLLSLYICSFKFFSRSEKVILSCT
jgi:hypothetical protein